MRIRRVRESSSFFLSDSDIMIKCVFLILSREGNTANRQGRQLEHESGAEVMIMDALLDALRFESEEHPCMHVERASNY